MIVTMFILKRYELREGYDTVLAHVRKAGDYRVKVLSTKINYVKNLLNHRTLMLLGSSFFKWLSGSFHKLHIIIENKLHKHHHSKKIVDMISGRNISYERGGASFFLKNLKNNGNSRMH